jgi:hypothetical protein
MIRLSKALGAWQTPTFKAVLKDEIEHLDGNLLPLQQGLEYSSVANTEGFTVTIQEVADTERTLRVKTRVLYTGLIAGCSCADDPTPLNEINESCEVEFVIDKTTAETVITLLAE